jgi:hypothetical protein
LLHRASVAIAAELDLEHIVQLATVAGAAFGSFIHRRGDEASASETSRRKVLEKTDAP